MASYLVTGSTRGIGFELVRQLSEKSPSEVSTIIATSRSVNASLQDLADRHPGRVVLVPLDVTVPESIQKAAQTVESIMGDKGLDVLINNAGIGGPGRHFPGQRDRSTYHHPELFAGIAKGLYEEDRQHVMPLDPKPTVLKPDSHPPVPAASAPLQSSPFTGSCLPPPIKSPRPP
ncbi:uncharacterized protein An07g00420 [Aspergillus niger]|uniref:Contig An07c0010, genomic contig n=2 Tax=Aspergillus niger TaxID=5061 RepID=A2QM12_ASPNC|nr:uncharacterized protein An07g00420 [Aspergillus niger]CAK39266.1 unnamed protein product [Aspergillus niger]